MLSILIPLRLSTSEILGSINDASGNNSFVIIISDLFPTIRFTSEQETRPLFFRSPALFSNQVAMFFSEAEEERVRKELKAIEQSAGRRPEDKKEEKISLDIDLLSFDDRVLKPEDLKREYVVKGLEELKYNQI